MTRHHRLPSLDALQVFESAARLGSFKAAAAAHHVTATAVSHRIRALEASLGFTLFTRQIRAITLTTEGRTLFSTLTHSLSAIADTIENLQQPVRHAITISATPEFAALWLVPRLMDCQRACPDIDLKIHASYEPVDLNAGKADLAIRYGSGHFKGVAAKPLFRECFGPVVSPALKRRLPADPRRWPLIHLDWHQPGLQVFDWPAWAKAAGIRPAELRRGIRYSDGAHAVQAAIAGQGVALLGLPLLAKEIRHGLLAVLPGPQLPGDAYHVCTPSRRAVTPAMKQVLEWLMSSSHDQPSIHGQNSTKAP
ncbi:MAG: LysR substrate-binding domain-containing protein [Lautropia sp.]|nr:LysR substrate-binding domain-containing protein [Lautropia sp.]